jgi:hypothetical protein
LLKEMGVGRAVALASTLLAQYAAVSLSILVATRPAQTGQALLDIVTPVAEASSQQPVTELTPHILPSSAQLKQWDAVEHSPDDFDPLLGHIQD